MKSKKDNFYIVLLWGIVIYAVALLTYCTMEYVLRASADHISAFGSVLGASGAFFAAFVAAYLFNDWRDQHNKSIANQFALDAYKTFSEFEGSLMGCAHKIDLLASSIIDERYEIILNTPKYNECLPAITQIIDDFNLIKMQLVSYFDKLRAYAAVTGKTDQFRENLNQYVSSYTEVNNLDIKKFDSVQDFISIINIQMKKTSDLSKNIYDSSVKELLESLQVQP
ncbi:hypothetical protein [Acinetobacter proteolyticus]|uniref:hypothetical protein n=1 Tax=Acinetobacter proteolyticus TaxID=1776741 RepID=UPI0031DCB2CB